MGRKRNLPPNVSSFVDRHGKERFRFRKGGRSVYLLEHPGTAAHPSAEVLALASGKARIVPRAIPGSIDDLVYRYYSTAAFTNPSAVTQSKVRAVLEDFRSRYGKRSVKGVTFDVIEAVLALKKRPGVNAAGKKVGGPNAAKTLEKHLTRLFDLAIKLGWIETNPARLADGVKVPKTPGFHSWDEDEIKQYRGRHPLGTKGRLAIEIILWTLQRRGDASRFGPAHRKGGKIKIWNEKTKKYSWLPEPPQLAEAIEAMQAIGLTTYLVTEFGKPFTPAGFGNWFRRRCDEAGLPHCSAHGLRKATARRLADLGNSQQRIKAAGNWVNDRDVATYVADADQRRLADDALTELAAWELANLDPEVSQTAEKKG